MVICKYFLRGTCRFGENCKNEHSYNDNSGSVLRKKQDIDPNVIIKSVSNDMDKAENGNQWPFSCYGPFQGKACFPGFEDKCFEEIRLGLYEAERNGTAEQYKQQLTQLINETRMKMRSLQNPTPEATNVLKELFNSNSIENQSTNTFANSSNSVFGNNPTNQSSIFSNTVSQNVFATQPVANNTGNNFTFSLPENKNIFGNAANNQVSSGSIFSQNNQPGFSTSNSIFGGGPTKSIFANTQQTFSTNTNVFQTNTSPSFSTNSGSIFSNQQNNQLYTQQPTTGGSIFAHNSPFAQNNPSPNQPNPSFAQNNPTSTQQNSPFAQNNPIPNQTNPSFAQNNSIPNQPNPPFVQNNPTSTQQNPFTQQNTADPFRSQQSSDPFTQNSTDIFKQNVFQQNIQPSQSPFNAPNTFGQNSVLHSQNQGTINSLAEHAKSIFGSMTSQVGFQNQVESRRQDDATIYSKLEDLTEKDIKCFEAASFEFGKIPENPPTLQMC